MGGSELSIAETKEIATLERSGDLESGMAAFFAGIIEGDFPEPGPAISPMAVEFITTMDYLVKSGEIANIPHSTWAPGGASQVAREKMWVPGGNGRVAHEKAWAAPPNSIQKNPRGTQCTGHYGCDCRKRVGKCKHFVEPPAAADAASASTL